MKQLGLVLLSILSFQCAFAAEKLLTSGEVFDKEGKTKKFIYERYQEEKDGKLHDRAVYKDTDGDVLVEEKIVTTKDHKLISYDIQQKQLDTHAWIETTDKKITFNLKKFRKNNYPQTYDRPNNVMMPMQIATVVEANWDNLTKSKDVPVKLAVWYRQEMIAFNLSADKNTDKELVVKMNPSSMFIRAVVKPLYFTFDKKTKKLTTYLGRTTPKEKRGRDYYDFDGLTKYK